LAASPETCWSECRPVPRSQTRCLRLNFAGQFVRRYGEQEANGCWECSQCHGFLICGWQVVNTVPVLEEGTRRNRYASGKAQRQGRSSDDVRVTSAHTLTAAQKRTFRHFAFGLIGDISHLTSYSWHKKKDRLAAVSPKSRSGVLTRRLRCPLYFFQLFSCAP
jgi:hypothetical protein